MEIKGLIKGIHHVTATVDDAQEDYRFYSQILGLRLVKKTVNFDDNRVYHFYYGDKFGTPGTIMTTFPYKVPGLRRGVPGSGQVARTSFSIPGSSLGYWKDRLEQYHIPFQEKDLFSNSVLFFDDPSGLKLALMPNEEDIRIAWSGGGVPQPFAIKGIFGVTLSIAAINPSMEFLTNELGFRKVLEAQGYSRLEIGVGGPGHFVDIQEDEGLERGKHGIGLVHHVAFKVEDEDQLEKMRTRIVDELGMKATELKDRKYFRSVYFRMPGKIIFELATINPGFMVDESEDLLGEKLQLPEWEEERREEIEENLPEIKKIPLTK